MIDSELKFAIRKYVGTYHKYLGIVEQLLRFYTVTIIYERRKSLHSQFSSRTVQLK